MPEDGSNTGVVPDGYAERSSIKSYWLLWALATAAGALIGGAVAGVAQSRSFSWFLPAGLFGLSIGIMQSLALWQMVRLPKRRVLNSLLWLLACLSGCIVAAIGGFCASLAISFALYFLNVGDYAVAGYVLDSPVPALLVGFFGGLGMGSLQRRILVARSIPANRWTKVSTGAWLLACLVGFGVGHFVPGTENVKWIAGGASGGIVAGGITGHALAQSLRTWQSEGKQTHE